MKTHELRQAYRECAEIVDTLREENDRLRREVQELQEQLLAAQLQIETRERRKVVIL